VPPRPPATMGEAEDTMARLLVAIEEQTDTYRALVDHLAHADADWKHGYHKALLAVNTSSSRASDAETRKADAHERARRAATGQAITGEPCDLYLRWRAAEEAANAVKESIRSLRTALDAYRTLAANIRSLDT